MSEGNALPEDVGGLDMKSFWRLWQTHITLNIGIFVNGRRASGIRILPGHGEQEIDELSEKIGMLGR